MAGDASRANGTPGLREYIAGARAREQQTRLKIDAFSARIAALRALTSQVATLSARVAAWSQASEATPSAGDHWLARQVARQEDELTAAHEELRAQHETLEQAHEILERALERYVDLFENAPEAYLTTDGRGFIREANQAAAEVLGAAGDLLAGKRLVEFVRLHGGRSLREELERVTSQDGPAEHGLRLRLRGGVACEASLTTRGALETGGAVELRWILRPVRREASEAECELLAAAAEGLRADDGDPRATAAILEDIDQIVRTAPEERAIVAPAELVASAAERARERSNGGGPRLTVGSMELSPKLGVGPERTLWALSRLLGLVGDAKVSGWVDHRDYVVEL